MKQYKQIIVFVFLCLSLFTFSQPRLQNEKEREFVQPLQSGLFFPGEVWNDVDGNPIESHCGGIFFDDGTYYWVGSNWNTVTLPPNTFPNQKYSGVINQGTTIYSSTDLINWKLKSVELKGNSYDSNDLNFVLYNYARPKIVKNNRTNQYILMSHRISKDYNNDVVYAVADSPTGPYHLKGKLAWANEPNIVPQFGKEKQADPYRIHGWDIGLFQDDNGKAYLISAHHQVYAYELSDDYQSVTRCFQLKNTHGEAPAMFKHKGHYYLLTSGLSGWYPNKNKYYVSDSLEGVWESKGQFAFGENEDTNFNSQTTFVLPVRGKEGKFIYMSDRFHAKSNFEIPDMRKSTHIWLPVELDEDNRTIQVNWQDSWALSDVGM